MSQTTTAFADETIPARSVSLRTISYYAVFLSLGLMMMALGVTLTELARRTHSSFDHISYLFLTRSMGFFLGSIFGGRIYDRIASGHKVLAIGLMGMAVCAAFVPLMPNLPLMVALFLLQGLAGSLINVGGNTMLLWSHRHNITALLAGLHFSWGLGSAISPLIVEQIEKFSGSINWAYWGLSLFAIPVCWCLLRFASPPHPHKSSEIAPPPVKLLLAILVGSFFFLYTGFEASLIGWIHTYTMQTGLGDKSAAYKLNSAFLMLFTFGRLIAIPIAARMRPRTILLADILGCFMSAAVILLWSSSATVLWIASCTLGLSMASIFPTMLAFAERRMPLSGKLTGYLFSASSGGSMILPFIVGQFFVSIGPQFLFYLVLGALCLDVILLVAILFLYPTPTMTSKSTRA